MLLCEHGSAPGERVAEGNQTLRAFGVSQRQEPRVGRWASARPVKETGGDKGGDMFCQSVEELEEQKKHF